jgi:NADH-quinone oxidoreductase subunit N
VPVGDVLAPIVIVVGAVTIVLFAAIAPHRWQPAAAIIALGTCGAAAALAAGTMWNNTQRTTFSGTWSLDDVAGWGQLIIIVVAALTVGLSPEWMRTDPRHGEWYAIVLFSTAGAMVMTSATDVMELIVGVLLSSTAGYVLAAYHRRSALSTEAGTKYFLIGALTNVALLIGATLLFALTGTTTYATMRAQLGVHSGIVESAALVLIIIGIAFKIGAAPAHQWVPDVAQGAPAPASAFLTIAPKVGGLIALARIVSIAPGTVGWRPLVAAIAVATMTLGNLGALWQTDVRRLLGWSSISQAGYALIAVAVLGRTEQAIPALLFFLAAYAFAQLAAFGVVTELRGLTDIDDYRGLGGQRPLLAIALGIAMLSMAGIPPLAGFSGKLLLFGAAIDGGYGWLAVVAVANTVISLFYYLRLIAAMTFDTSPRTVRVLGRSAAVATGIATIGVIALGIGAEGLLKPLRDAHLVP